MLRSLKPFLLAAAVLASSHSDWIEVAMGINQSQSKLNMAKSKVIVDFQTATASAAGCTPSYQCVGLLCSITADANGCPVTTGTGQCQGFLCAITYP